MFYFSLFILSLGFTFLIKIYTKRYAIFDVPNQRSLHSIAVPRGGGLAIIITFFIGLFLLKDSVDPKLFYALFSAIPIVFISILDDIYTLPSMIRLVVQSISAILGLYTLGGVSHIDFVLFEVNGVWVNFIAFLSILWLTNLYNFLDGIDGYAATQAVTIGIGLFLLFHNSLGLVIVMASLGFLVFNWHKASIFMGDVGSVTLGYLFAIFIFYDTSCGNIYIWLILLSLFWFDATITLVRRYINSENLTQAHKKHAYQRLVESGWMHDKVVLVSLVFNSFFLLLLYIWEQPLIIFLINIIGMIFLYKLIEKQKSFK